MWERSPTARLIWGLALMFLVFGFGGVALASGDPVWIATFLFVIAVAVIQLTIAGPPQGRLWDSWLTKLLYAYVAFVALKLFGTAAFDTGSAWAIVPLVAIVALISVQLLSLVQDHRAR